MRYLRTSGGWVGLIGILIAMAIVGFLFMFYLSEEQTQKNPMVQEASQASGISTSSHAATYQSTVSQIEKINERNKQRGDELMRDIEAMQQY